MSDFRPEFTFHFLGAENKRNKRSVLSTNVQAVKWQLHMGQKFNL